MTTAITDFTQYAGLRATAQADPRNADVLREVAAQFEALFVQTLLKNMRDASLGEPLFGDSSQHGAYVDMLDKQLAVEMSRKNGFGIADVLVRQLGSTANGAAEDASSTDGGYPIAPRPERPIGRPSPGHAVGTPAVRTGSPAVAGSSRADGHWDAPETFVRDIWPHARQVAARLGVEPRAVVAQAALESGWGAHVMPTADGGSSFNLFGIKAGAGWSGASVSKATLEFADGIPRQTRARFRAYDSLAAAFDDYADFLGGRPRYAAVLDSNGGQFAAALQEAGYATDPEYAAKIERVMASDTLRESIAALKAEPRRPITGTTTAATGRWMRGD